MVISVISSGRDTHQILIDGYRMCQNQKNDKNGTVYFRCVKEGCPATAATVGDLKDDVVTLKYHNRHPRVHNHGPDAMEIRVQKQLHDFRECARENPDMPSKQSYDKLTRKNLSSLSGEEREEFLGKLPPHGRVKDQHYRIRNKIRPNNPKCVDDVDFSAYGNLGKTADGKAFFR